MLLDRQRVRFWQKWIFGIMALLMASFLIFGYSGVLGSCNNRPVGQGTNVPSQDLTDLKNQLKAHPKDYSLIQQLASLYATRAAGDDPDSEAQKADYRAAAGYYEQYLKVRAKARGDVAQRAREQVLQQLGSIYAGLGEYVKAESVYTRLTVLRPKNPLYFIYLGQAASQAGDNHTAVLAYDQYLELAPNGEYAAQVKSLVAQLIPASPTPQPSGSAKP